MFIALWGNYDKVVCYPSLIGIDNRDNDILWTEERVLIL